MVTDIIKSKVKHVMLVGCFGLEGKRGGTRTYIDSIEKYLETSSISVDFIPHKSKKVRSSYSCMLKIFFSILRKKIPKDTIIHAQRPDDLIPFTLLARKNLAICVLHGDNLRKMKLKRNNLVYKIYKKFEKMGLERAQSVICVDRSTYNIYVNRYPWLRKKSIVIPIGIDADNFYPRNREEVREELDIPLDSKVMLVVSRLEKEKNVKAAIELVKDNFDYDNHTLLIIGEGKEERMLRDLSSSVEHAKIIFLGQISYEKMPYFYNLADILLVTSLFESGPLVILEALACGIPCVSTDVGRANEFLSNSKCGTVVTNIGAQSSNEVKKYLYANDNQTSNSCISSVRKHTFDETGSVTIKLFEKLMGNNKC